jgi:CHAD domain-containing protein
MAALAVLGAGVVAAGLIARRRAAGEIVPEPARSGHGGRSRLKRATLKQLDRAIALLEGHGGEPREQTVHEARKALKRARALVRLQREALGAKRFGRVNTALRDAGRGLAGARDAEVIVDALDLLVERHPRRLGGSGGIAALRADLVAERERLRGETREGAPARTEIVRELRATRGTLERWEPPKRGGAGSRGALAREEHRTARRGLERIYREGRARRGRARRAETSAALHEWRKRVKDLRYVAEALDLGGGIARRADRLGETIGAEHDMALLAASLREHRACLAGERETRRTLKRLIRRRQARLRSRAWRLGEELYRRKPRRFVRRALVD